MAIVVLTVSVPPPAPVKFASLIVYTVSRLITVHSLSPVNLAGCR